MTCIIVRCQNGVVVWERIATSRTSHAWQCTRDKFQVPVDSDPTKLESYLVAIAQHSSSLAGAILQVVQLTL